MKPKGLTPNQDQFCLEYIKSSNASEAYRRAYPKSLKWKDNVVWSKASTLLADGRVQERIAQLREKITEKACKKLEITKEWVLEQLVENVNMAKAAEPVLDNEGSPTGEYKVNIQAANRSLELIGKEIGMFVDRKDIMHRHADLKDDEIEDEIGRLEREIEAARGVKAGAVAQTTH